MTGLGAAPQRSASEIGDALLGVLGCHADSILAALEALPNKAERRLALIGALAQVVVETTPLVEEARRGE